MVPNSIIHIRVDVTYRKPERLDFIVDTLCGIRVPEVLCGNPQKATCPDCLAALRHRLGSQRLELVKASPFTPPITLIVPAHNEEGSIVGSVGALLGLEYPRLEVIVVNDGSDDATMERLRQAYQLQTARILYIADIATAPLHAIYRSRLDPRLFVRSE